MKYEYKVICESGTADSLEAKLNELGAQGWKMVAATEKYNAQEEWGQDTIYLMREV